MSSYDYETEQARECYFASGGFESQIQRDEPGWYWRRAAKMWREQAESLQRRRDRVLVWCAEQGCYCGPGPDGIHNGYCPGVAEEILKGAHVGPSR